METRGKSKSHARAYLARAHRVNKCECANAAKSSRVIRESSCKHPTKAHACDLPNPPLFCERWRVLAKKLADKSRKCTRTWPMFKYFTSICSSLVHQFDAWLRSMYKKKKKKKKMEYYFVFPINLMKIEPTKRNEIVHFAVHRSSFLLTLFTLIPLETGDCFNLGHGTMVSTIYGFPRIVGKS